MEIAISMSSDTSTSPPLPLGLSAEPVQQHILQRHVRQSGLAFIVGDVAGRVAVKLQQAHDLPEPSSVVSGAYAARKSFPM